MGDDRDWLRSVLYLALAILFLLTVYKSFDQLYAGNVAVSAKSRTASTMFYPTVTVCPTYGLSYKPLVESMEDLLVQIKHSVVINGRHVRYPFCLT